MYCTVIRVDVTNAKYVLYIEVHVFAGELRAVERDRQRGLVSTRTDIILIIH